MNSPQTSMMMKAIETRFHGPTNRRGSRVIATEPDGSSHTHPWDYALNSTQNHASAARALADKLGWNAPQVGGALKNSCVWVFTEEPSNQPF